MNSMRRRIDKLERRLNPDGDRVKEVIIFIGSPKDGDKDGEFEPSVAFSTFSPGQLSVDTNETAEAFKQRATLYFASSAETVVPTTPR